ncbi:MAG: hypothetical protein HY996_00210 [Micrococcales bacterium]|nr:hypothetical protein [Micrococcales bacterium]
MTDLARQDHDGAVSQTDASSAIVARFDDAGGIDLRLEQAELPSIEALRPRIALYPRGTRFRLEVPEGGTPEELAGLRRALRGAPLVE